jgi:hypothetical protein
MKRPSDYLDDWTVSEEDEKVGIVALIAAFSVFAMILGVILLGAVIVAAWTNALP